MKLHLLRYSSGQDDTLGLLMVDGRFGCYTLEDEHRDEKVPGETRIPAGEYRIQLRTFGGFHARYSERFAEIHRGMLWLREVPSFTDILIHCGNSDDHTAGCILLGDTTQQNITQDGFIGNSEAAYRRVYPSIAAACEREEVTIEIEDAS